MQHVINHRKNKGFSLSIPVWHWSSLVVTIGNMGYLPKYEWSHFGSLSISFLTPLLLFGLNAQAGVAITVCLLLASCLLGHAALLYIHEHGVEADHDASAIVIDEVAGSAVAMLALPSMMLLLGSTGYMDALLFTLLLAALFRFFDILKPYPADVMDTLWHHPFAVVADDLVAGVYAAAVGIAFAFGLGTL